MRIIIVISLVVLLSATSWAEEAATNKTTPAATTTETPAATNKTTPTVTATKTPEATNKTTPTVKATKTPAATNKTTPTVKATKTPEATNKTTPTVKATKTQAVTNKTTPTVKTTKTQAVTNKTTPTAEPTTKPSHTNTTTHVTTAKPSPVEEKFGTAYNYNFTNNGSKDGMVCVKLVTALRFNITYLKQDGKIGSAWIVFHNNKSSGIPTAVRGTCPYEVPKSKSATAESEIVITYNKVYKATFTYTFKDSKWYQSAVKFEYNLSLFPDAMNNTKSTNFSASNNSNQHKVGKDYSLVCNSERTLKLNGTGDLLVTMQLENMHVQAFNVTVHGVGTGGFKDSAHCPADTSTNNIVPIAVGCALAALVLIVLIAYLIGRRRNNQSGYQSV